MLKQVFLAHFEPVLTEFSPFHHMYAPLCALWTFLRAVWWSHLELGEGCRLEDIYIYIYMCVCVCVCVCVCMYIAPPLPKEKLPQLPRPRETKHESTRPGVTHGALGSLTSSPPFTFPSPIPFPPCIPPPPVAAAARRPPLGPAAPTPAFPATACNASHVTTAPLSPTPPARAGLPRWGMRTTGGC